MLVEMTSRSSIMASSMDIKGPLIQSAIVATCLWSFVAACEAAKPCVRQRWGLRREAPLSRSSTWWPMCGVRCRFRVQLDGRCVAWGAAFAFNLMADVGREVPLSRSIWWPMWGVRCRFRVLQLDVRCGAWGAAFAFFNLTADVCPAKVATSLNGMRSSFHRLIFLLLIAPAVPLFGICEILRTIFITFKFPQILRKPTNPKLGLDPIFNLRKLRMPYLSKGSSWMTSS